MYKVNDNIKLDEDDICSKCLRYHEDECDYVLRLKNLTNILDARLCLYGCDKYCKIEDDVWN